MTNSNTTNLHDSSRTLYDIIVDVVGDESSLEFCTLTQYYIDDDSIDAALNMHGTNWDDIKPLMDEVEQQLKNKQDTAKEPNKNTSLDTFFDGCSQPVVAYAYEVAKFSVFDDSPDRKVTDWTQHVDREKPSEEDWKQEENIEHRIRNITPLVRGSNDVSSDEAIAFEYTVANDMTGSVSDRLETHDPRGVDDVIRCTPLIAKNNPSQ